MNGKQSREALLEFLDYLARKGLMNKTTASARKAAANKILGILDDQEAEDITNLDIDHVLVRFSNIAGSNYTPDSLNTYKSRLKSAIDDFKSYQENPMTFRPSVASSGRKPVAEKPRIVGGEAATSSKTPTQSGSTYSSAPVASVSILPIPIRPNLTIHIQGLPYDLTTGEAAKIANVIKAMASSE